MGGFDRGFVTGAAVVSEQFGTGVSAEGATEWLSGAEGEVAKRCQSIWYSSLGTDALSDRPSRFFF